AGGHGGRAGPGGGNDGGAGRGDGGGGYPSFPHPDWNGDFASAGCQLVGGYGGWAANESGSDHPGTATIDRTNVGEGNCSARFSIPAGSGTGRAEVQAPQLSTPVSVVWEELLYIPSVA